MAYTYFGEVAEGRSGSVDQKYQRAYKRVFLVKTDSSAYGPYYAGSHPSLPVVWSVHPEDSLAYCTGFSVDQDQGDVLLWRVVVNYAYNADTPSGGGSGGSSGGTGPSGNPSIDTQQAGQAPADRVQSPLSRVRDYTISSTTHTEAVQVDENNYTINNSAGDPFVPAAERTRVGATLTVGLNNANAPNVAWLGAVGKVNASSLTIGAYVAPAQTVKLQSLSANLVYENGVSYWRWSLTFEFRPLTAALIGLTSVWTQHTGTSIDPGWFLLLLDMGRRKLPLVNGQPTAIENPPGTPVPIDVALDGSGLPLASGARPYYSPFQLYKTTTFPSPL